MANFSDFKDGDSEGANVNIVDPSDPTKYVGVTSDNRLPVQTSPAKISTLNSTSTPLLANTTFTGTWEDVLTISTITVSVFTSHDSATDGFKFQTSTDGVNWDNGDTYTVSATIAGEAKVFSFGTSSQYIRIIYTNGSTNQITFRLQTLLHSNTIKTKTHKVEHAVTDEDDALLTKSVITGKTDLGVYKNVSVDDNGRILISGQSEIISPLPSLEIVERRVLLAGTQYAFTETITQDTAVKEFTFGGRGPGEGMFGRYVAATEEFIPSGNFESVGEVANWTNTGVGDGLGLTLTYSTTQANTGTGSLQLGPATRSDNNHYPQITYTWSSPQNMDSWRYVSAYFYNFPPVGGAVTRTISIRLQDINGIIRVYSVAGLTNAAPFNAAGWINILGEIRIPTSQIGTDFDINNVSTISLRMQDSGNKAYTDIYWDSVKLIGSLDIIQKIYTSGTTVDLNFDPIKIFITGEVAYFALRNNDTVSREYQITIGGVDIS